MFRTLKNVTMNVTKENLAKLFYGIFPERSLLIMVLGYTVILSILSITKHWFFLSTAWDLGIFNQSFWSTTHGKFFHYTVEPWFGETFFAVHFSPILVLLVPFYAIYPCPETLLVLQSLLIALGAVPLYHLSKELLNQYFAKRLSLIYVINPTIIWANLFDFHVEAFLPVTLFSLMYFLHKRDFKFYAAFLFLSLSTLEFTVFLVLLILFYELVANIKRREELRKLKSFAVLTLIASAIWLLLSFWVNTVLRLPETRGQSIIAPIISELSTDPPRLIFRIIDEPFSKLWYIIGMSWPFLFTSLLSTRILMIVPWFLVAFALNYEPYYKVGYQYTLIVIPFFALAAIFGTKKILPHIPKLDDKKFSNLMIISAIIFTFWASTSVRFPITSLDVDYAARANRILSFIPGNASVLTINTLHPHVSSRFEAWVLPLTYGEPYEGFDTGISNVWKNYTVNFLRNKEPDFIFWDINKGGIDAYNLNLTIHELLARRKYGVYALQEEILLLKKGYEGTPLIYEPINRTYNFANLTIHAPYEMVEDSTSRSGPVLFFNTDWENETLLETEAIFLPQGNHKINLGVKITEINIWTTDFFVLEVDMGNDCLNYTVSAEGMKENEWNEFHFDFEVKDTLGCVVLRGIAPKAYTEFYIDYIDIFSYGY